MKLKAELASRLLELDPAAARAELDEIVRLTGEAISGVRGTVTGFRADGLAEQLTETSGALATAGIALDVRGSASALSPAQAIPAAWILREATTNVLRHAGATRVVVTFAPGKLTVSDDGVGIGIEPGADRGRGVAGNGLRGMSERAAAAGAELRIESAPGQGTQGTQVSLTW